MKTKYTEALGGQRAKRSKNKARYSQPTRKELLAPLCTIIIEHNTVAQRQRHM